MTSKILSGLRSFSEGINKDIAQEIIQPELNTFSSTINSEDFQDKTFHGDRLTRLGYTTKQLAGLEKEKVQLSQIDAINAVLKKKPGSGYTRHMWPGDIKDEKIKGYISMWGFVDLKNGQPHSVFTPKKTTEATGGRIFELQTWYDYMKKVLRANKMIVDLKKPKIAGVPGQKTVLAVEGTFPILDKQTNKKIGTVTIAKDGGFSTTGKWQYGIKVTGGAVSASEDTESYAYTPAEIEAIRRRRLTQKQRSGGLKAGTVQPTTPTKSKKKMAGSQFRHLQGLVAKYVQGTTTEDLKNLAGQRKIPYQKDRTRFLQKAVVKFDPDQKILKDARYIMDSREYKLPLQDFLKETDIDFQKANPLDKYLRGAPSFSEPNPLVPQGENFLPGTGWY